MRWGAASIIRQPKYMLDGKFSMYLSNRSSIFPPGNLFVILRRRGLMCVQSVVFSSFFFIA